MKLFPPDPEITLYETGFGDDDPFNRAETGKSLSELVERIEDPLVIALDGEWGCGKTWFLKRWVGAHEIENDGRATTVYFDAFAHDFLDDPLIALTGVIGERLAKIKQAGRFDKAKGAVAKLAKPVTRVALATVTGGVTELGGALLSSLTEATADEIKPAIDEFWKREEGRREAMEDLRDALTELTKSASSEDQRPIPLVVVVDELDRCRPDYALALLEIIKHFFSVEHVHFVLGVNRKALEHSVRARYGSGIDAERYLRKFVSLTMHLPTQHDDFSNTPIIITYFLRAAKEMKIDSDVSEHFRSHLHILNPHHALTMRDVNQVLSRAALINPGTFRQWVYGYKTIAVSICLIDLLDKVLGEKLSSGAVSPDDIGAFYNIKQSGKDKEDHHQSDPVRVRVMQVWSLVLSGVDDGGTDILHQLFDRWMQPDDLDGYAIIDEVRGQLSKFTLPPAQ